MAAVEIHLPPSDRSPEVFLHPDGIIKIKGRGFMFNTTDITQKIANWIDTYLCDPAEITQVTIAFEYLNSFTTSKIVSILRKLVQLNLQDKKLVIKWYYEHDDNDILERGEYMSSTLDIPFEFIKTRSISNLKYNPDKI
jgi:hypothetical protein